MTPSTGSNDIQANLSTAARAYVPHNKEEKSVRDKLFEGHLTAYRLSGLSDKNAKRAANSRTRSAIQKMHKPQRRAAERAEKEAEFGNGQSSAAGSSSTAESSETAPPKKVQHPNGKGKQSKKNYGSQR